MPKIIGILAAALASAGAAVAVPTLNPAGPPVAHTGGFGEPTCVICHEGNALNAFGGRVSIEGLPGAYQRGETYLLTVILDAEETTIAGFELAARYGGGREWGRGAGELLPLGPRVAVTQSPTGVSYAHQTADGTEPVTPDRATWLLEWVAPTTGGPVAFNVAANSGNGDNSPLRDLVFTWDVTIPPLRDRAHR
jgi:hypothetical protein